MVPLTREQQSARMLADLGDGKCGDTDEDAQPTMVRAGTKMTGSKAAALGAGSKPESEIRGWGTAPIEADHPSDARLRETIATAHMASMGKAKLLQPSAYSYVLIECCAIALDMHIGHSECAYWCACAINNLASFARLCAVTQIERRVERRIEIRDAVAGGDSEVMEQLAEQAEHDAALALGNIAICHLMPTLPLLIEAMKTHETKAHVARACAHACAYVLKSTTNDIDGDGEADDDALLYLAPNFCAKLISSAAKALRTFPGRELVQFNGLEMLTSLLDGHCSIDLSHDSYRAKVKAEKEAARKHAAAVAASEEADAAERRAAVEAKLAAAEKRRKRRAHNREMARREQEQEEAEVARLEFARKEADAFLEEERNRRAAVEGGVPEYLVSTSWTPLDPELEADASGGDAAAIAAAIAAAAEEEEVTNEGDKAEAKESDGDMEAAVGFGEECDEPDAVDGDVTATVDDEDAAAAGEEDDAMGEEQEGGEEEEASKEADPGDAEPTTDAAWIVGGEQGDVGETEEGGTTGDVAPSSSLSSTADIDTAATPANANANENVNKNAEGGRGDSDSEEEEYPEETLMREGKIAEALVTLLGPQTKLALPKATLAQSMKARAAAANAAALSKAAAELAAAKNDVSLCAATKAALVFDPREVQLLPLLAAALRNHTENAGVQHMASKAIHALIRGCPSNAKQITTFRYVAFGECFLCFYIFNLCMTEYYTNLIPLLSEY